MPVCFEDEARIRTSAAGRRDFRPRAVRVAVPMRTSRLADSARLPTTTESDSDHKSALSGIGPTRRSRLAVPSTSARPLLFFALHGPSVDTVLSRRGSLFFRHRRAGRSSGACLAPLRATSFSSKTFKRTYVRTYVRT